MQFLWIPREIKYTYSVIQYNNYPEKVKRWLNDNSIVRSTNYLFYMPEILLHTQYYSGIIAYMYIVCGDTKYEAGTQCKQITCLF